MVGSSEVQPDLEKHVVEFRIGSGGDSVRPSVGRVSDPEKHSLVPWAQV